VELNSSLPLRQQPIPYLKMDLGLPVPSLLYVATVVRKATRSPTGEEPTIATAVAHSPETPVIIVTEPSRRSTLNTRSPIHDLLSKRPLSPLRSPSRLVVVLAPWPPAAVRRASCLRARAHHSCFARQRMVRRRREGTNSTALQENGQKAHCMKGLVRCAAGKLATSAVRHTFLLAQRSNAPEPVSQGLRCWTCGMHKPCKDKQDFLSRLFK